ncbi:hypothetical protein [Halospeciosus flavus]|uniref:DUF7979 domain-containing protein n=1 Tax=Halospeciosus flavus TaxID=3032283 RepID=A0ABD5Z8M2_9EURY|nr:hypothetical protein [Halospeciosus flavus]
MNPTITIEEADSIPVDANVRDYDELHDAARAVFPSVVDDTAEVDERTAAAFVDGEFVKFTGYYRVRVAE